MNIFGRFKTWITGVTLLIIMGYVQILSAQENQKNWSSDELLTTGRALSFGTTLTGGLKHQGHLKPIMASKQLEIGADISQINTPALAHHTNETIKSTWKGIVVGALHPLAGPALSAAYISTSFFKIYQVGIGEIEPDALRFIVPHTVMAWDALKGPQNLPFQKINTSSYMYQNNAFQKIETFQIHNIQKSFSTTAPGITGKFGYDPSSDRINHQSTIYSSQHKTFSGQQFNQTYRNHFNSWSQTPIYIQPQMPSFKILQPYSISPPLKIPNFQPIPNKYFKSN